MSTITNGFVNEPNTIIRWCHNPIGTCGEVREVPLSLSALKDNEYFILQAKESGSKKESKITLKPPFPADHNILFSYDTSTFEWMVEAEKIGTEYGLNDTWQINVNVEIGPKI